MSNDAVDSDGCATPDGVPIRCSNVVLSYRGRLALADITLSGHSGVTALLGPNGAGKTTLLRAILGELRPDEGQVQVLGLDPMRHQRTVMKRVGWMRQEPPLPKSQKLIHFITYAGWLKGLNWSQATQAARSSLSAVDLADRADEPVGSLSGGMQRRAAFAAAVVHSPTVLLLDEPMVGLDPEQRVHLRESISRYGAQMCVVLSTHILQDLPEVADRIVILNKGTVRFDDTYATYVAAAGSNEYRDLEKEYFRVIGSQKSQAA